MKQLFTFLCLLSPLSLYAQGISVLQAHTPQEIPFAKPFVATVQLSHPQGQSVQLDKDSVSPDFTVTQEKYQPLTPDTTQASLLLLPFGLQASTFTASFSLAGQPDAKAEVQIPLTITPVKLFNDNELKEIRPPHRPFDWALWLCILLALVAIACLIIWWVRKIKKSSSALLQAEQDNRPAHVIALSQLDALIDSGLWENKQYKVFYITLTDILRNYLQKAFGLDVSAETSAELLRHLKMQPQLCGFIQSLRALLSSGDLVKFAKAVPTETTRNTDITILREFITQTAPKPAPEKPQAVEVKL